MSQANAAVDWSNRFGLALDPLFDENDPPSVPGDHYVLLDGGLGTFALSVSNDEIWKAHEPAGWAWSSDIPHHVTVTDNKVAVLRWDAPRKARIYDRAGVERSIDRFYAFLIDDRVRSNRSVVEHLLNYFRRIRSLSSNAELPDTRTTDIFVAALARLIAPEDAVKNPGTFGVAEDAFSLCDQLSEHGLTAADEEVLSGSDSLTLLRLFPSLAIRHAGGLLFQEAHFELLRASPNFDLFGLIDPPETKIDSRGGTHFTPPALARSIVEQSLAVLSDLQTRVELTVCDPACGSGAFLHESLRALRRLGFTGRLKVIGIDISNAAISMARFALSVAIRDWAPAGGVELQLICGDALGEVGIPQADVIVMNPPFISFGAQTPLQREQLRQATDASAARGDFSMAFISNALTALKKDGVLGTLFPASLLSLKAAGSWRDRLASEGDVRLLASIGEFGLFSHAIVQVACAVIHKTPPAPASKLMAILTSNNAAATGEALRQVRKLGGITPIAPIIDDRWSLFPVNSSSLAQRPTWRLPTPATERLLSKLQELSFPTVGDLFEVAQGIQTGLNDVLLLTEQEWRDLPKRERAYFRIATMTDSIQNARVERPYYVFFPHTKTGPLFPDEASVQKQVPQYFRERLAPARERLSARASLVRSHRKDWWGLMHPRLWAFNKTPRIITKFFAAEGGFFGDYEGEYVAVMGHVWTPRKVLAEEDQNSLSTSDLLGGYVALLNSQPFSKLLSLFAPHVAGGQFDLSVRHVAPIPMPDLRALSTHPRTGRLISELIELGREVNPQELSWRNRSAQLVMELYGSPTLSSN